MKWQSLLAPIVAWRRRRDVDPADHLTQVVVAWGEGPPHSTRNSTRAEVILSPTEPVKPKVTSLIRVPDKSGSRVLPYGVGRIPYTLNAEYLASLHRRLRRFAVAQMTQDAAHGDSTPMLHHDIEFVPLNGSLPSRVKLGALMYTGMESTLFELKDHKDLVIRYASNCRGGTFLHPMSIEYFFLKYLEADEVVPRALFLSPPVRLEAEITPKTNTKMSYGDRVRCVASPTASVRYLVMQRVRGNMAWVASTTYWSYQTSQAIRMAARMGYWTIISLWILHDRGVIHGSIHNGNVVRLDRKTEPFVGFVDFGAAFFADSVVGRPERIREPLAVHHCHHSPYQIMGSRTSYRDDVFGAILMVAFMINGADYTSYCLSLQDNPAEMLRFKRDEFLFSFPRKDPFAHLEKKHKPLAKEIRTRFSNLLALARGVEGVDDRPPYADITDELRAIVLLFE